MLSARTHLPPSHPSSSRPPLRRPAFLQHDGPAPPPAAIRSARGTHGSASLERSSSASRMHTGSFHRPASAAITRANEDYSAEFHTNASNILVAVRLRPENERESLDSKHRCMLQTVDENIIVFDPVSEVVATPMRGPPSLQRRGKDIRYAFDRVFDQSTTNVEVYENTTKQLIPGVLDGYNATVFAYGATGAGKTHTMSGQDESGPGVMILTMRDLFKAIEGKRNESICKVSMQYLEVYNEQIRDLLDPERNAKSGLDLREDPLKGMVVAGLSEHFPTSADEVLSLLSFGNSNRTQHPTEMNQESSRSHAVLQIIVEQRPRTADFEANVRVGKLSLIDLAGSERATQTKNRGARLKEGANINKSLLALGNCINALTQQKKGTYIPYRDSKLTRLLKDSLGGNCRTVMIAAVSPSSLSYEDTHNTLKYANRAKNIKTRVAKNSVNVKFHLAEYNKIVQEQRFEIEELKKKIDELEAAQLAMSAPVADEFIKQREEAVRLVEVLRAHHAEKMKLKRSIMILEERDKVNHLALLKTESQISRWKRDNPKEAEMPVGLHRQSMDLKSIRNARVSDSRLMHDLKKKLERAEEEIDLIQERFRQCNDQELYRSVTRELQAQTRSMELERSKERTREFVKRYSDIFEETQENMQVISQVLHNFSSVLKDNNLLSEEYSNELSLALELCDQSLCEHLQEEFDDDHLDVSPGVKAYANELSSFLVTPLKKTSSYQSSDVKKRPGHVGTGTMLADITNLVSQSMIESDSPQSSVIEPRSLIDSMKDLDLIPTQSNIFADLKDSPMDSVLHKKESKAKVSKNVSSGSSAKQIHSSEVFSQSIETESFDSMPPPRASEAWATPVTSGVSKAPAVVLNKKPSPPADSKIEGMRFRRKTGRRSNEDKANEICVEIPDTPTQNYDEDSNLSTPIVLDDVSRKKDAVQVTRTSPLQNLGSKVIDELEGIPSAPLSSLSSVVSSARDVMKQSAKISSNASEAIQNNESGGLDNLDFSQFSASTLAVLRGVDQALKQYDFSQYKPTSSTDTLPKLQVPVSYGNEKMDLSELGFPNRNASLGSGSQSQLNSPKERDSILDDQENIRPSTAPSVHLDLGKARRTSLEDAEKDKNGGKTPRFMQGTASNASKRREVSIAPPQSARLRTASEARFKL